MRSISDSDSDESELYFFELLIRAKYFLSLIIKSLKDLHFKSLRLYTTVRIDLMVDILNLFRSFVHCAPIKENILSTFAFCPGMQKKIDKFLEVPNNTLNYYYFQKTLTIWHLILIF